MSIRYWITTDIPELSYTYIAGFRVERLITTKGVKYCIGEMKESLIKFERLETVIKFLTV